MIPNYHLTETFEILDRLTKLFISVDLRDRTILIDGLPRVVTKIEKLREIFTGYIMMRQTHKGFQRFR